MKGKAERSLVTVLANKSTCSIFLTATSPKSSQQTSLNGGQAQFFADGEWFFALAIWLATKYDTFSAFLFIDVVALRNFSDLHVLIFFQNPRACFLIHNACYSSGKTVLLLHERTGCSKLSRVGLVCGNHRLQ